MSSHPSEVDEGELRFLILHYLSNGPCRRAAQTLLEEATAQNLLPTRTDIFGHEHPLTYEELTQQHSGVSPQLLLDVFSQRLSTKQSSSSLFAGLSTVLGSGVCSVAKDSGTQQQRLPSTRPEGLVGKLLDRGVLGPSRGTNVRQKEAPQLLASCMAHQKTVRGHHMPVYCLAFDRTGMWLLSGSDDHLIKIWSLQTGLLQMACRGHTAEITDLAVSCNNTMFASSSNDFMIRVWDLKTASLGHPVSVLIGHGSVVSYIDFHPTFDEILLSSSLDGTCRVWNAVDGLAVYVLKADKLFGPSRPIQEGLASTSSSGGVDLSAADGDPASENVSGIESVTSAPEKIALAVCAFSPDGTYIVAGAKDCACYMWMWQTFDHQKGAALENSKDKLCVSDGPAGNKSLPGWLKAGAPSELCRLPGHKNDVLLLQFSNDGSSFATGSKDGTLRVWRRPKRRGQPVRGIWQPDLNLASPIDEEAIAQARRRRRPPPNPSINQLAWTKDDSKIMATISDNSIMVWDAQSGEQQARMTGHKGHIHVLEGHPQLHNLIMSASYDGQTIIWDLKTGGQVASFSTKDTRLGEGQWVEPLHLMDGHWTVDGLGIVVSDSAGQLHFYGTGASSLLARAKYDQFVEGEMRALEMDINGYMIDADLQVAPHLAFKTDRLCDYLGDAYDAEYQAKWKAGKLWQLSVAQAQANSNGSLHIPAGLHTFPPILSAAAWNAQEGGADTVGIHAAVIQVQDRQNHADLAASEIQPPAAIAEPEAQAAVEADSPAEEQQARQAAAGGVSTRRTQRGDRLDDDQSDGAGAGDPFDDEFGEIVGAEHTTRAERLALRNRRRDELLGERQRRRAQRRAQKRRRENESDGPETRRRVRSRLADDQSEDVSMLASDEDDDTGDDDLFELDEDERPRRLRPAATIREQRRSERRRAGPDTALRLGASANVEGRSSKAYSWLQDCKHRPGVYVPQFGDEVIYIWYGHKQYMDNTNDKGDGPWTMLGGSEDGSGSSMRAAEPCRVISLTYKISLDSAADTYATVRLQLTDPASPLCGKEFEVDVPPSHLGQAEFVIAKSRFQKSLERQFGAGERCKIFYPDEAESGRWWRGRIVRDKLAEAGEEAPNPLDLPYQTARWERFSVAWDMEAGASERLSDDQMITQHAAWEMFDEGTSEDEAVTEGSRLPEEVAARVLAALDASLLRPAYSIFVAAPDPDEQFPTSDGKGVLFYNQIVDLPMSLLIIQARLQHGFYRQVDALKHDAELLTINARKFNGEDSELAAVASRLATKITCAADGVDSQPSDEDDAEEDEPEEVEPEEEEEPRADSSRLRARLRRRTRSSLEEEPEESDLPPRVSRRRARVDYTAMAGSDDEDDEEKQGSPSEAAERRPRRERQEVRRYSPGPEADRPQHLARLGMSLRSRREADTNDYSGRPAQAEPARDSVPRRISVRLRPRQPQSRHSPAPEEEVPISDSDLEGQDQMMDEAAAPDDEKNEDSDANAADFPKQELRQSNHGLRVRLARPARGRRDDSAEACPHLGRPTEDSRSLATATARPRRTAAEQANGEIAENEEQEILSFNTRSQRSRRTLSRREIAPQNSADALRRGQRRTAAGRSGLRQQQRPSYKETEDFEDA